MPASRWARATRVSESSMNSTRLPCARNHSAMAVATKADLRRTRLGASLVAATTTERARPAGPRGPARQAPPPPSRQEAPPPAPALADERDDVHLGVGLARDLAHQRRLADARAGEEADALP